MANSPAIQVEGIGKLYKLEHARPGSQTFRDFLTDLASSPVRRFRQLRGVDKSLEEFWALRDISFEVHSGEAVGIIGRNGAGKSTLLKILSRIVEPTRGQVVMRGRVASLLEVGTGFHPELSGRENIYLNGSILGMKRREIRARFDRIVEFAEIEKFLDTPVKRYSSGMYVRLAFAVAAHLEPEILIVDEVLAVGDAEFQKRCLGKMKEISSEGTRTVLFVSHNMSAIRTLCSRGILLDKGRIEAIGSADAVVDAYMAPSAGDLANPVRLTAPTGTNIRMESAAILVNDEACAAIPMGSEISLEVRFVAPIPLRQPRLGFVVSSSDGERILGSNNRFQAGPSFDTPRSQGVIRCDLKSVPFMPGRYAVSLWLGDDAGDHHVERDVLHFDILERDLWGLGQLPPRVTSMWWPTTFHFSS